MSCSGVAGRLDQEFARAELKKRLGREPDDDEVKRALASSELDVKLTRFDVEAVLGGSSQVKDNSSVTDDEEDTETTFVAPEHQESMSDNFLTAIRACLGATVAADKFVVLHVLKTGYHTGKGIWQVIAEDLNDLAAEIGQAGLQDSLSAWEHLHAAYFLDEHIPVKWSKVVEFFATGSPKRTAQALERWYNRKKKAVILCLNVNRL